MGATRSLDKDPLNQGLLLSLPMFEGTGAVSLMDVAKPHHPVTITHAPVWTYLPSGLPVLSFTDDHPDYLTCAAASSADLDFTTGSFSCVAWVYTTTGGGYIINKCDNATCGYVLVLTSFKVGLYTYNNAGSLHQTTATFPVSTWWCIGATKSVGNVSLYYNGSYQASAGYVYATLKTAVAIALTMGTNNAHTAGQHDGYLWNPRIWPRELSPAEHRTTWMRERHLFGV